MHTHNASLAVLYLACDCDTLTLGNLSQQLLALTLFFLVLINFSLQLLKLQILQTFCLLPGLLGNSTDTQYPNYKEKYINR